MSETTKLPNLEKVQSYLNEFVSDISEAKGDGFFLEYVTALSVIVAKLNDTGIFDVIEVMHKALQKHYKTLN